MRPITDADIKAIRTPWVWDLGNRILYDMCKEHPYHRAANEIVAKVWLIGRSYAASIERRRNADESGDDFYETIVVPAMQGHPIDTWIESIEPTDNSGSPMTVAVHKRLMNVFHAITKLEKRSLVSKYLHFHKPDAFFIYDSRARRSITKVVPRLNQIPELETDEFDLEYKAFVRRCIWLRDHIERTLNHKLTPREIDKLLLMIAIHNS